LDYNSYVTLLSKNKIIQENLKNQAGSLNDNILELMQTDTPSVTSFVSNAYYAARDSVLHFMNLAARTYNLWDLDTKNILTSHLEGYSPREINYTLLESIQANFWKEYELKVISTGPTGTSFKGNKYANTYHADATAIESLKAFNNTFINLTPNKSCFGNYAEVRISYVRAYIEGAKTSSKALYVGITHGKEDNFIKPDGKKITFTHQQIGMPFTYNLETKELITPNGADFRVPTDNTGEDNHKAAVLSPFTTWILSVTEDADTGQNIGLDLSGVTSIDIEFDGVAGGIFY
jgi:hypothetical protein